MIQRIQTVYLVLGVCAIGALPFFNLLWESVAAERLAWFSPTVVILGGLVVVTAVVSIFLYKQRKRQRSVVLGAQVLTVLLLIALYGGLYLVDGLAVRVQGSVDVGRLMLLLLPVVAYVFFFLARRSIEKDIELVRSMDRLR